LIQLAYIVYSENGEKLEEGNHTIKPEGLVPVLVKAIQEQQSQIEELKTLLKA
jgi:hypothetical protein